MDIGFLILQALPAAWDCENRVLGRVEVMVVAP